MATASDVLEALSKINDPDLGRDIVSLDMVKDVQVDKHRVSFGLELQAPPFPEDTALEESCREAVSNLDGISEVQVRVSSCVSAGARSDDGKMIPSVKNTIAVASGKGGVGKSTVAINLAVTLARKGARVGLLDADVYGPSIPMMAGLEKMDAFANEDGKIAPVEAYGLKIMSMGFLIGEDQPVIWRGPMVHQALNQFLGDVNWGELDYLILDLPPGTGDVQLTLVQTIPLTGALITCTPQDVALLDARKGLKMFQHVNTNILGIVENMSWYECPHCGERSDIFSHGGAAAAAQALEVPFLGGIPIDLEVRQSGDAGRPYMADADNESSPVGRAYLEVAHSLVTQIKKQNRAADQSRVKISIKR